MTPATRIGFIGTGAMGSEMALRLLGAGYQVVVSNRTRANAARVEAAGATWAALPCEVAKAADIVITCLLDSDAVKRVYLGTDGLIEAIRPESLVVEHGTFAPAVATEIGEHFAQRGTHFVDMPVTGGPEGTRTGRLAAMGGGERIAFERAAEIAAAYCSQVTHVGRLGSGLRLKLVNQQLVSSHMAAAAEAIALLNNLDIDLGIARAVLEHGWAGSAMLSRAFTGIRDDATEGTGVKIGGMIEIQDLIAGLLESPDTAPVFTGSRRVFDRAIELDLADTDPAALYLAMNRYKQKESPWTTHS